MNTLNRDSDAYREIERQLREYARKKASYMSWDSLHIWLAALVDEIAERQKKAGPAGPASSLLASIRPAGDETELHTPP